MYGDIKETMSNIEVRIAYLSTSLKRLLEYLISEKFYSNCI